jgi:hypothetical protein
VIVGFTVFKDANSKFQMMHVTSNVLYSVLAYVSFLTNLSVAYGTFIIIFTQPDAFNTFIGYGALLGIIALDNQIANWLKLFLPCQADNDFMEIEFSNEARANSRRVMNCQIFLYIAFNVTITVYIDENDNKKLTEDDGDLLENFSIGYMCLAAILPVLHIQWFHRSWIFKCIPKCEVKVEDDKLEVLPVNSSTQEEEDAELQAQANDLLEQANLLMEEAQAIQKKIK